VLHCLYFNKHIDNNIIIAAREGGRDMLKKVLDKFSLEAKNVDKKDIIILGMEEKGSSNGPNTGTFTKFHIVNHNKISER
jgi:hypothetical protein